MALVENIKVDAYAVEYKNTTAGAALDAVQNAVQYIDVGVYIAEGKATHTAFAEAAAAAYAQGKGIRAVGTHVFSSGFECQVPFDFSGAEFHIGTDWDGSVSRYLVYLNHPGNTTATRTVTVATGGTTVTGLESYTNHCVAVRSTTEVGYVRAGANIFKGDVWHIIDGVAQGYGATVNLSSSCTVTATPLDVNHITCYLPKVVFDAVPAVPVNHVFRVERAFVDMVGGSYNTHAQSVLANRQCFNAFVNLQGPCYRVTVRGLSGYGFFKNASDGFSYAVNLSGLYPAAIECVDPENWGLVDGTLFKGGVIRNCRGARMGAHEDWTDLTVEGCTAYTRGFMLGSGFGQCTFRDNVFYMREAQNAIEFRYDYSNNCKGNILIDGMDVHLSADIPAFTALVKFQVALTGSLWLSANVTAYTCNSLTIRNINVYSQTQQTNAYEMWNLASNFTQYVQLPSSVLIENVQVLAPLPSYVRLGVTGVYYSSLTQMNSVRTYVTVKNVIIPDPANNNILNSAIADANKASTRNSYAFSFENVQGISMTPSLPDTWSCSFRGCRIYRIDGATSTGTDAMRYYLNGCSVYGTLQCRTRSTSQMHLTDVLFETAGTVLLQGIVYSSGTRIISGSTISGQSITAAQLLSYRDTSVFA